MKNDPKFITVQCHANAVAEQALLAFYRPEVAHLHEKSMRDVMAILAADMGYTLTPVAVAEKVAGFLEELRDFKPDVISGRAHDPQDDVDDMTPLNTFEAFQSDAADLLKAVA